MILQCSKETGIHFHAKIGEAMPLDMIEFIDDVEVSSKELVDTEGNIRRLTTVRTPAGEMSEVFLTPVGRPACWQENFVKSDKELPILAYLMERTTEVALENAPAREKIAARFAAEAKKWPTHIPLCGADVVPAFIVMSQRYMGAETAFYLLADHRALMERVFQAKAQSSDVWLECAAEAGADYIFGAINGLEIFSPDIYRRYFVPQAGALHQKAHELGLMTWVHTCGHMDKLIEMDIYEEMAVDILESLSHPPLGDVTELALRRAQLGSKTVTRGGVNVNLFYENDIHQIRQRTRTVLEQTQGHRHMIGDTNDSFPPYPRENIMALVDEVDKTGRLFPA